ncbi:protein Dok-7 isoform X1 [Girardinichthys multiradiatus]|uniref:protein Dok-7 isoform X1 n=1 Tax=Girardinichthys multiradiatus TaxID=208333 RepID=UPI001FAD70B8|nr:protein Dok-7 isoform X1 [Girardinichthys multiradiatus]
MTDTVVAEGQVKFRDGKKWKTRWVVLQKPSPVADCLTLLVCKDKKKGKSSGHKERLNVTLEEICGVEPGPGYDGVPYTLSILCLARTLILGFKNRDALLAWDARIRYSLGEVHRFLVSVEPGTKLESGAASLHLCNNLLVLSRGLPPVVTAHWKLSALRRYGAVPNGFVFEGGTRCGFWAGVFFLSCSEGEQISFLFDCIVRGIAPSRALHGLPPNQPAAPDADPASEEKRISQETSELEKRLSMLSQCSLASSSSSTYSTSIAGDDHSFSSSSSSQSDASYGSRFPFWVEQSVRSHLFNEMASSTSTLKALTRSDDRLYGDARDGSGIHPSSVQHQPRWLNDCDRQSSLDSGIGIATGSQLSYSGSYSSCNGSLDMASQGGGGEDNESVASPSAPLNTLSSPPPASPPTPPSSPFQPMIPVEHTCPSRCLSQASRRHSEEYHIPCLLRQWYDTPRSLLQAITTREPSARKGPRDLGSKTSTNGSQEPMLMKGPKKLRAQCQWMMQRSHSWGSERASSMDSEGRSTPSAQVSSCSAVPGEAQRLLLVGGKTSQNKAEADDGSSLTDLSPPCFTKTQDSGAGEKLWDSEDADKLKDLRRMFSCSPPSVPPPPPLTLSTLRTTSTCGKFPPIRESHLSPSAGLHRDYGGNYVNIPSAALQATTSELLYSELNLHSSAHGPSPYRAVRQDFVQHYRHKDDSIRYAHLDIAAMETAQRVGAEHVQGREDRLTQLESRWRGPPN